MDCDQMQWGVGDSYHQLNGRYTRRAYQYVLKIRNFTIYSYTKLLELGYFDGKKKLNL